MPKKTIQEKCEYRDVEIITCDGNHEEEKILLGIAFKIQAGYGSYRYDGESFYFCSAKCLLGKVQNIYIAEEEVSPAEYNLWEENKSVWDSYIENKDDYGTYSPEEIESFTQKFENVFAQSSYKTPLLESIFNQIKIGNGGQIPKIKKWDKYLEFIKQARNESWD